MTLSLGSVDLIRWPAVPAASVAASMRSAVLLRRWQPAGAGAGVTPSAPVSPRSRTPWSPHFDSNSDDG